MRKNRKMMATASRPFRISLFKTRPPLGFPPYVQRLYHEPTPGTIRGRHGEWADEGAASSVMRHSSAGTPLPGKQEPARSIWAAGCEPGAKRAGRVPEAL